MAQKDMFISELLDRIAIVECEVGRPCVPHLCVVTLWCGDASVADGLGC